MTCVGIIYVYNINNSEIILFYTYAFSIIVFLVNVLSQNPTLYSSLMKNLIYFFFL